MGSDTLHDFYHFLSCNLWTPVALPYYPCSPPYPAIQWCLNLAMLVKVTSLVWNMESTAALFFGEFVGKNLTRIHLVRSLDFNIEGPRKYGELWDVWGFLRLELKWCFSVKHLDVICFSNNARDHNDVPSWHLTFSKHTNNSKTIQELYHVSKHDCLNSTAAHA